MSKKSAHFARVYVVLTQRWHRLETYINFAQIVWGATEFRTVLLDVWIGHQTGTNPLRK